MVSEQVYPRQESVGNDWVGNSVSVKSPNLFRPAAADYGGDFVLQFRTAIHRRWQEFRAQALHRPAPLPRLIRSPTRPSSSSGFGGGLERCVVKVPDIDPGKIPKPASISGKMMESTVKYEAVASDPTAVWRVVHLRPSEEPRDVPDRVPPAELKNEKTRRTEDLRQINMDGTQGVQLMSTPEGNFDFSSTGPSVVVTGWGEEPLPNAFTASPTLNMIPTTVTRGVSEEVVPEQGERFNHPITISYPSTHNLQKDIMPADLDWSIADKQASTEEGVLNTLNKQIRHFTGSGNTPLVYPLRPVIEELQKPAEGSDDRRIAKMCFGILKAIKSQPEYNYITYRKGIGVVCNIRNEMVKVLRSMKPLQLEDVVIGQHKSHQCYFIRLKLEYFKFSSLDSYEISACNFNSPNPQGKYNYGWLAKEEDYKSGDLKAVADQNDSLHMAGIEQQTTDKSVLRLVEKHKMYRKDGPWRLCVDYLEKNIDWLEEKLKPLIEDHYLLFKELEEKQLSVSGPNWGRIEISGNMLSFNVVTKETFEVPLVDVTQTQMQGKMDVVLEFHVDDTIGANEKGSLMDLSFHVRTSNTQSVGDECRPPAQILWRTILNKADIGYSVVAGVEPVVEISIPVAVRSITFGASQVVTSSNDKGKDMHLDEVSAATGFPEDGYSNSEIQPPQNTPQATSVDSRKKESSIKPTNFVENGSYTKDLDEVLVCKSQASALNISTCNSTINEEPVVHSKEIHKSQDADVSKDCSQTNHDRKSAENNHSQAAATVVLEPKNSRTSLCVEVEQSKAKASGTDNIKSSKLVQSILTVSSLSSTLGGHSVTPNPSKGADELSEKNAKPSERAGNTGVAVMLFEPRYKHKVSRIERESGVKFEHIYAPQPTVVAQSAGTEAAEAIASLSSQYFDLLVKRKNDQEHLFRKMPRDEYHNLCNFIIGKYLKILNLEMGIKDMDFVQLLVSLRNSRFIRRWIWSGRGKNWRVAERLGKMYPGRIDRFNKAQTLEPFSVHSGLGAKNAPVVVRTGKSPLVLLTLPQSSHFGPSQNHQTSEHVSMQVGSGQSTWQLPGVYYLEVLKDGEVIVRINLDLKRHIFGRHVPACNFVLDHQSVPRQHAVSIPHKNGSIYVIDLGSVHCTFVASERLTKDHPVELEIGQSLRLAASIRTYILRKNSKLPMERFLGNTMLYDYCRDFSCGHSHGPRVNISRTVIACIILGFILLFCVMLWAIYKTNQPQLLVNGSIGHLMKLLGRTQILLKELFQIFIIRPSIPGFLIIALEDKYAAKGEGMSEPANTEEFQKWPNSEDNASSSFRPIAMDGWDVILLQGLGINAPHYFWQKLA